MYEASAVGLIEDDPATATFDEAEASDGEWWKWRHTYAALWAIGQFQEAAMDAGMSEDVDWVHAVPRPRRPI